MSLGDEVHLIEEMKKNEIKVSFSIQETTEVLQDLEDEGRY